MHVPALDSDFRSSCIPYRVCSPARVGLSYYLSVALLAACENCKTGLTPEPSRVTADVDPCDASKDASALQGQGQRGYAGVRRTVCVSERMNRSDKPFPTTP